MERRKYSLASLTESLKLSAPGAVSPPPRPGLSSALVTVHAIRRWGRPRRLASRNIGLLSRSIIARGYPLLIAQRRIDLVGPALVNPEPPVLGLGADTLFDEGVDQPHPVRQVSGGVIGVLQIDRLADNGAEACAFTPLD